MPLQPSPRVPVPPCTRAGPAWPGFIYGRPGPLLPHTTLCVQKNFHLARSLARRPVSAASSFISDGEGCGRRARALGDCGDGVRGAGASLPRSAELPVVPVRRDRVQPNAQRRLLCANRLRVATAQWGRVPVRRHDQQRRQAVPRHHLRGPQAPLQVQAQLPEGRPLRW